MTDNRVKEFIKTMEDALGAGDINLASKVMSNSIRNSGDAQTADKMLNEVTAELYQQGKFPSLVKQFASSNFSELDLDGDGSISDKELQKIDESPLFKGGINGFEHQMVKYMRTNYKDMVHAYNNWGFDNNITKEDLAAHERKASRNKPLPEAMKNAKHFSAPSLAQPDIANGFLPDLMLDFGEKHLKALDLNDNGYVAKDEIKKFTSSTRWGGGVTSANRKLLDEMADNMKLIQQSHGDELWYNDTKGATIEDLRSFNKDQHSNRIDIPTKPGDHNLQLTIGGVNRDYMVHIPPGYDGTKPLPVLYFYHYFTGDGKELANETGMSKIADRENFIVVYPNAKGWVNNKWRQWNLNNSESYRVDEVAFAKSLMDTMENKLNVDKSRVYVAGYSNGGMLAHELAAKFSDRVAAMASVSGCQTGDEAPPATGVPVMLIHGDKDRIVPVQGRMFTPLFPTMKPLDAARDYWRKANGADEYKMSDATPGVRTETYTNRKTGGEVKVMTLLGSGHVWPGSPYKSLDGTICDSINGSEEIWKFLSKHQRQRNVPPRPRITTDPKALVS